jgi:putative transposase
MNQTKTDRQAVPVDTQLDPEVISFRAQFDQKSPLDELVREGARRMLQSAIDAEVDAFIALHDHRRDQQGRRLVVRNGSLPEREILTGAGALPVQQGRVRDNTKDVDQRVVFTPSVLPA